MIENQYQNNKRQTMNEPKSEKDLPLISIGIPTYNRPEGLRRALKEITNQTYPHLDIIVSDNASTSEETKLIAEEFLLKDKRVRYFRQQENRGPIFNFQFVLEQAKGEYFMWASDDDWHELNFVEELYVKLSADSTAVVAFCDFDSRDEKGAYVAGYPNFLSALKQMCEPSAFRRQIKYFLIKEGTSKPHPIYGLIRRDTLAGFSWTQFAALYRAGNAIDVLFVFWLMTQGRLALVEKKLFGCTVGNPKEYAATGKWTIVSYTTYLWMQIKYIYGYLRIAHGATKLTLALCLPWKLLELTKLFVIQPGINVVKRLLLR